MIENSKKQECPCKIDIFQFVEASKSKKNDECPCSNCFFEARNQNFTRFFATFTVILDNFYWICQWFYWNFRRFYRSVRRCYCDFLSILLEVLWILLAFSANFTELFGQLHAEILPKIQVLFTKLPVTIDEISSKSGEITPMFHENFSNITRKIQ